MSCKVSTCDRKVKTKGLCNMHYKFKWRTGLDPELHAEGLYVKQAFKKVCKVSHCCEPVKSSGLCNTHYKFVWRTGLDPEIHNPGKRIRKDGSYTMREFTPSDGIPWPATLTM